MAWMFPLIWLGMRVGVMMLSQCNHTIPAWIWHLAPLWLVSSVGDNLSVLIWRALFVCPTSLSVTTTTHTSGHKIDLFALLRLELSIEMRNVYHKRVHRCQSNRDNCISVTRHACTRLGARQNIAPRGRVARQRERERKTTCTSHLSVCVCAVARMPSKT